MAVAAEDAVSLFLDMTHRTEDLGEPIDSLICDIARSSILRDGSNGIKKARDGDMEREWSDAGELDPVLLKRIKAYRIIVGVQ